MYIRKVKIRNVRGFDDLDLDFSRPDGTLAGWTVLAGRNGSGKSTLLQAMALAACGTRTSQMLYGSFGDWLRVGAELAEVEVEIQISAKDVKKKLPEKPRRWRSDVLVLRWKLSPAGIEPSIKSPTEIEAFDDPFGWFLAGYGPSRRLTGHAVDAQRLMEGPPRVSRLVSLFREDSSLIESVQWLREIYLRRLEEEIDPSRLKKRPSAAHLENTVLALLNDGLLPDRIRVEKVDSEGLWVEQQGARLPLTGLSAGYRTMAALVLDIVRHLYNCFGKLDVEEVREEDCHHRVRHYGVVLIDQVDLHLHVSWQKGIGFWLKRHFPNIQFIVTTHSPFVCQAADARGLIRLPAPGESRSAEHVSEALYNTVVNGGADDAVLTELFGLETPYSADAERLRERISHLEALLQSGKAKERDRRELKGLRTRLPQTLTADVEQALRKLAINE